MYFGYCRKSTEAQNETSYQVQADFLIRQANALGMEYRILEETGSGGSLTSRPIFMSLLETIKEGDVLGCYDQSRISRNDAESFLILNTLMEKKAKLHVNGRFISGDDPQDRAIFGMQSIFANYQKDIQHKKSIEGMNQKRMNGDWVPGTLYGYNITHGKHPTVTINEDEAKWVRYAFNAFINGTPYRQISLHIKNNTTYNISTTRVTELLRNPQFMGYYYKKTIPNSSERSRFYRKSRKLIENELIHSNLIPQIVDEDTWWKVHEVEMKFRESGNRKEYWNRHRTFFELTSLVKCRCCGVNARHTHRFCHGIEHNSYELANHLASCNIYTKEIDQFILESIARATYFITLLSYNNTAMFFSEAKNTVEQQVDTLRKYLNEIESQIAKNKKKQQKYVLLFEDDDVDIDISAFKSRLKALKKEATDLEAKKQSIENEIFLKESDISEMLGELTEDKVEEFVHTTTQKRNMMYTTICNQFVIDNEVIHIEYKNGMTYEITLNERFKRWNEWIPIRVFFKDEPQFTVNLDRDLLTIEYDRPDTNDIWLNSVYDSYAKTVERANQCMIECKEQLE